MAGYWMGVLLHEIAYERKLRGHDMTMASEFLRSKDGFNLDADSEPVSEGFLKDEINRLRKKLGQTEIIWFQRQPEADKVSESMNEPARRKHGHYFKDVSQLTTVDVYRVCALFGVNDPSGCTHHAIKKLLLPGQRGAGKDAIKDLQEAVDTLNRKIEMLKEDAQ